MSSEVGIIFTAKDLTGNVVSGISDRITSLASTAGKALLGGVAAAGAGFVGLGVSAFNAASQARQGVNDLESSLGVARTEAEELGAVALDVFKSNFGDSIADANASIVTVRQQMGALADDELGDVTKNALRVRDVFGVDIAKSTNTVNTLVKNFGLTNKQAFDFIAKGYQNGLDASGDFLDSIGEYAPQFQANGASAAEFFSAMQTGMQGGVLGTDKVTDLFKEMRLRISEDTKATRGALNTLGINANTFFAGLRDGSMTGMEAFGLIQDGLRNIEDPMARQTAGVALLGTQWEDMGPDAVLSIDLTKMSLEGLNGATDSLNAKYDNLGQVAEGMWRRFQVALIPAGDAMLAFVNDNMPKIEAGFGWLESHLPIAVQAGVSAFQTGWPIISGAVGATYDYLSGTVWPWMRDTAFPWLSNEAMPAVQSAFETAWPLITSAVSGTYTYLHDTVWPWLRETAFPWLQNEAMPAVQTAFETSWPLIKQATADFSDWFHNEAYPAMKEVFDWIVNTGLPDMVTEFRAAWPENKRLVQEFVDFLNNNFKPETKAALDQNSTDWARWNQEMGDKLTLAQIAVNEFGQEVRFGLGEMKKDLAGFVIEWAIKLAVFEQTAARKIAEVVVWFQGLPGRIGAAVGDLTSTLRTAGTQVISGLLSGIKAEWAEKGASVLGAITRAIPRLKGPPDTDAKLLVENGRLIIAGLIKGFDLETPAMREKLTNITKLIGDVFDVVGKGADTVGKLADFVAPARERVQAFAASAADVVNTIAAVASRFKLKGVEHAATWADSASKILGIVGTGVDALTKLPTYAAITRDQVLQFSNDVVGFVSTFAVIVAGFDREGLSAAELWASSAGKILAIITTGVDALMKLPTYAAITRDQVLQFGHDVVGVVATLAVIASGWDREGTESAALWATAAGKILSVIGTGVDVLLKLPTYAAITRDMVIQFGYDLAGVVSTMEVVSRLFDLKGVDAAALWATAAGKIIALIGPSVDALTKLADIAPLPPRAMDILGAGIALAVVKMLDLARRFDTDGVEAAGVFGTAVGKIISPIGAAVDAFTKLREYKGVLPWLFDMLGADIRLAVVKMMDIASKLDADGVEAASVFSAATKTIVDALGATIKTFTDLANYKGIPAEAIKRFQNDFYGLIGFLQGLGSTAGGAAGAVNSAAITGFGATVRATFEGLQQLLSLGSWQPAIADQTTVWTAIQQIIHDAMATAGRHLVEVVDLSERRIKDLMNRIDSLNNKIAGIKPIPGGGDGGTQTIQLRGYARGGRNISAGPAVVGENGPEVVTFGRDGANVYNNRESRGMLGGGLHIEQVVVQAGPGQDGEQLADAFMDQIIDRYNEWQREQATK